MRKKQGFTLAETLITIAIIGIVAALTIPSLITKYNEFITTTRLKKTYSELLQVIKLSEADNGSFREWDYGLSYENFAKKYIMPYFKDSKPYSSAIQVKLMSGRDVYFVAYVFKHNGKAILVQNLDVGGAQNIKYVWFWIDVNGKSIPQVGKDLFGFTLFNYTYLTGGWSVSPLCTNGEHYGLYPGGIGGYYGSYCAALEGITTSGWRDCNVNGNGNDCSLWIQKNGWKIPDKYPLKF